MCGISAVCVPGVAIFMVMKDLTMRSSEIS